MRCFTKRQRFLQAFSSELETAEEAQSNNNDSSDSEDVDEFILGLSGTIFRHASYQQNCIGATLDQNTNYILLENEIWQPFPMDVIILDGPHSPLPPPLPVKIVEAQMKDLKCKWPHPAKGRGIRRMPVTRRQNMAFKIVIQEINLTTDPDREKQKGQGQQRCQEHSPAAPEKKEKKS